MALAEECPHEAPETTSSFIPAICSQCLPMWVLIIGGEPGERLCCLDANPEIEFLLYCIPATGLQLVGGGGEFSGAGPGDPTSSFCSLQHSHVGSRGRASGGALRRRLAGLYLAGVTVKLEHHLSPRVCSKVGEAEQ